MMNRHTSDSSPFFSRFRIARERYRLVMCMWMAMLASSICVSAIGSQPAPQPDLVVGLWATAENEKASAGAMDEQGLIRKNDRAELRVYHAPEERATGTAVIICPGGGYGLLDYGNHVDDFVADYRQHGITVVALVYRFPAPPEAALEEGKRAVRMVRARAAEWRLDPGKVGMQGYSAGGHLILNLLAHDDPANPQAEDPLRRIACRPDFVVLNCPWKLWEVGKFPFKEGLPPVFLACADDDDLSTVFSDSLAERLRQLKAPMRYWRVEGGGHAAFHKDAKWGNWLDELMPWLQVQGFAKK